MKINVRCGDVLQDLHTFHRVTVESIGVRKYLIGTTQSGRMIALFALRPGVTCDRVIDALHAAIGSCKHACVLNKELVSLVNDADAMKGINDYNAKFLGLDDYDDRAIGIPNIPQRAERYRRVGQ